MEDTPASVTFQVTSLLVLFSNSTLVGETRLVGGFFPIVNVSFADFLLVPYSQESPSKLFYNTSYD